MRKSFMITLFTVILLIGAYILFTQTPQEPENNSTDNSGNHPFDDIETETSEQTFMSGEVLRDRLDELPDSVSEEIMSGGPPPDGIPSIDQPAFVDQEEADQWLESNEPVIWVEVDGSARAYPLQILMWHEIVNDTIDGLPVTVTFCPLCNSSFTFEREAGGHLLDFGTTGYLYQGAMLMYDRQTQSLWAHFGGEALGGPLEGEQLEVIPSSIVSWSEFKDTYPEGLVLSRNTSYDREYGQNPYVGYDKADEPPFLFSGEIDGSFAPKERIVAVEVAGQAKAYLTETAAEEGVINDSELAEPIVLFFNEGTASGLDTAELGAGREVGSTNVFFSEAAGENLEFYKEGEFFKDRQTESTWNFFGEAVSGPLEGEKLTAVPFKLDTFWFAWAAYEPDTLIHDLN
jgi:hypothetical protein